MLQETSKDKELQSLKHYISTGWPAKRSQIPVSLHPYWNFRDELTIECGILMENSKVLIPETLKQKYLMQIHQGIEACRSRAREFVFWVNINNDLKELVEKLTYASPSRILLLSFRNMFLKFLHIHGIHLVQIYSIFTELPF